MGLVDQTDAGAEASSDTSNAAVPGLTAIRVAGLTKTFDNGRITALQGFDLTVGSGELLVVVGKSGSGKSTLLRLLNGLETPTSGRVEVLGQEVATLSRRRLRLLRARVGFVFQQFNLVGRLNALENVLIGGLARLRGPRYGVLSYPNSERQEAMRQLDRVGLLPQAFQRADTLSGGQQQRVAVARTLFQRPEIVLADEPVASLDPESSEQVMRTLLSCCAEDGLTVVCSLHQVDLAMGWADRLIGLRDGALVLDRLADASLDPAEVWAVYGKPAATAETNPRGRDVHVNG